MKVVRTTREISNYNDGHVVVLDFNKEDLEDLYTLLTGVDGYYTPNGSSAAKLCNALTDLVVELLSSPIEPKIRIYNA